MSAIKRTEWGVHFGDQAIEPCVSYEDARRVIREAREHIKSGEWDAEDYEPMTLVSREVMTVTGEWRLR